VDIHLLGNLSHALLLRRTHQPAYVSFEGWITVFAALLLALITSY